MIQSITIPKDHPWRKRFHFSKAKFNDRLNILLGGNGSGKSSLIHLLEKQECCTVDGENIILSYRNSKDNDSKNDPSPFGNSSNYAQDLARRFHVSSISEGQSIIYSISKFIHKLETSLETNVEQHHVVLLDEIDSGLSCDHVNVVLWLISDLLDRFPGRLQFFVATNMYHWIWVVKSAISLYDGKTVGEMTYQEYFQLHNSNREMVGKKSDYNFL